MRIPVVMTSRCLLSMSFCLPLFGGTVAVTIDPATVYPSGAYTDVYNYSGVGWQFTPSQDIRVTALGVYDGGPGNVSDGLNGSRTVGLFLLLDQSLLVSTVVPAGSVATLLGGFRYVDISSYVLSAGVTYVIASTHPAYEPFTYAPPMGSAPWGLTGYGVVATADPGIALGPPGSGRYQLGSSSTLEFPMTTVGLVAGDTRNLQFGPNFQFDTDVPEPATLCLLTLGVVAIFVRAPRPCIRGNNPA